MKQKMLILLAVLMLLLAPAAQLRANAAETGTCGENLTWTLDNAGTLTISGTGAMDNSSAEMELPWYSQREAIRSIVVEDGVTGIGNNAFSSCKHLTRVTIPKSITSIGNSAFSGCTSLNGITIPDSVTSIGNNAFSNCTRLSSITIPASVTSIGDSAFSGCTSLSSITIPDSVTSIGNSAFSGCKSLGSITIPNSVTTIGDWTFYSCSRLSSVTLPDSITHIDECAFYFCTSLSVVHYAGTEEQKAEISIGPGNYEFEEAQWHYGCTGRNCPDLPPAVENGTCGENLTWTLDDAGTLTIYGTGSMDDYASESDIPWYSHRESILSVVVEVGVTSIGENAFNDCTNLSSVTIPASVTCIDNYVFSGCTSLSSITIPHGVTGIGENAFNGCTNLSSITIPESVTCIGSWAFYYCKSLRNITIPEGVTSIGDWTFNHCESLSSIAIPDSATSIGNSAFSSCTSLNSITIPGNVISIGNSAFSSCTSLNSITIPDSVTSIGGSAFYGCSSLSMVHYPGTEEQKAKISIGSNNSKLEDAQWHYECTGTNCPDLPPTVETGSCGANLTWMLDEAGTLTIYGAGPMDDYSYYTDESPAPWYSYREAVLSVVMEDGVTSIGGNAFRVCTNLSSVTIPGSVTSIGESAFQNCTNLSSVTIPHGVTSIGGNAFNGCTNLSSIAIPDGVTRIGDYAFYYCESLTSITIPEGVTSIGSSTFDQCESLSSVTIPEGVKSIGDDAFSGCENLSSITIPDSVTGIGQRAFAACESLTSITIPEGVTAIYFDTFLSCKSLSSITLPVSVTRIAEWAFAGCKNLSVVHYAGTEAQRAKISIDVYNSELENAQWHYGCTGTNCPGSEPGKPTTPPAEGSFVDVAAGSYYYTPVLWAVENGITNGLDATHFAPDATCTRAQVVTFLWRAKGCPEPKMIYNPFSDVSSSDYYYTAVLWAVENGITTGTGGNTFAPNEGCTRKQVATFLWRAQGKPASSGSNIFTDVSPDAYYYDAVLWAVENGITSGMGNGKFAPDAACTRGQIVTFLYRAMN